MLGPDHYFNALGYAMLAARRVGVNETSRDFKPVVVEIDFNPHTYDSEDASML
jgi:hypothetical protein